MTTNAKIQIPVRQSGRPVLAVVAAIWFLAVASAQAQTGVTAKDVKFMQEAAQGGLTEVKLGQLAAKKGTKDEVKEFGQLMVKDHGVMNDNLKALADQKGVALPSGLDEKHQALVDKMEGLPGSEFDDTYIIEMVKDHQADAKEFKSELSLTKDADLQSFLSKSIPVVEAHLRHVSGMQMTAPFPGDPKK